jgi:hypothetical protein
MWGKLFLLSFITIMINTSVQAVEVNSMRINGSIISIGDSESSLLKKAGKTSIRHSVLITRNNQSCTAREYNYRIDLQEYRVYICYSKVFQIDRINL